MVSVLQMFKLVGVKDATDVPFTVKVTEVLSLQPNAFPAIILMVKVPGLLNVYCVLTPDVMIMEGDTVVSLIYQVTVSSMIRGAERFTVNGAQLMLPLFDCSVTSGFTKTVIFLTSVSKHTTPLLFVFSALSQIV